MFHINHSRQSVRPILLALILLASGAAILVPQAHAAGPTLFSVQAVTCGLSGCPGIAASIGGPSEIILAGQQSAAGACPSPPALAIPVSDTFGNTFIGIQCVNIGVSGGGVQGAVWMEAATSTHATGTDTITATCSSCSFTIYSVVGFVTFGQSSTAAVATSSGSDTRTMSVLSGSLILGAIGVESSSVSCGSVTLTSGQTLQQSFPCQTVSGQGSISGDGTSQTITNAGTFTDSISWTCAACTNGGMGRFIQELQGSNSGSTVTVTQCFGNCGSPAVTLVNTNSTHTINFNQSLTIFYPFTSSLNGFFVNASVSVAKSYFNGQTVYVGLYVAASCPLGATPFSSNCPGSIITSGSFVNPAKGKLVLSVSSSAVALTNGENAAVAVSCLFSPCDLNDTNTAVAISQTNGVLPTVITQSAALNSCACKTGIWAFITGNIPINVPTITPGGGVCAGLDCILTNVVNSSCSVVTIACQTGSSLFWVIILTIISFGVLLGVFSEILPNANIGKSGLGELIVLIFIGWLAAFGSFSLLAPWVIVLMFFAIAWLFLGRVRGSGPI